MTEEKIYTQGELEILIQINALTEAVKRLELEAINSAKRYVEHVEFQPIQKIVYGMVGVILLSFLGAIITLVVSKS